MPAYFSTQPLYILRSPPINSRFAVPLAAISESAGTQSGEGHRNPNSPIYQASRCYLFSRCQAHPPPAYQDDLLPKQTRCEPPKLHDSSVTRKTAA